MERTMRLAIFKNIACNFETVAEKNMEACEDYLRISEYVDVDFPPREDSEIVNNEIASLEEDMNQLKRKIGELLALTHEG
jgi:hypothetical protein